MGKGATAASGLLAGRVAEQRRLAEVSSASAGGLPAAVLVHGEVGVGKTALVREVTEQYRASGREVLWGGGCRQDGSGA